MEVMKQIEAGILVCPVTKEPLLFDDKTSLLVTLNGARSYKVTSKCVPILLPDSMNYEKYVQSSERMLHEYSSDYLRQRGRGLTRFKSALTQDYRSKGSRQAFHAVFDGLASEKVGVSVGGGPQRVQPLLTNMNIAPFPNVDVVGDAHLLPYATDSVDAFYCDAVLEHLADPVLAVQEMWRTLKHGGRAYVSTPFLQAYHGYPSHFQNFTLTGHRYLFEQQGFVVDAAGTCVGPTWVVVNMIGTYLYSYFPRPFNSLLGKLWGLLGVFIRPLDIRLNNHPKSYVMASTTYLVVRKS